MLRAACDAVFQIETMFEGGRYKQLKANIVRDEILCGEDEAFVVVDVKLESGLVYYQRAVVRLGMDSRITNAKGPITLRLSKSGAA